MPQGLTDNSGQRISGLTLGRYVQIAGLSNYGNASAHGLGAVAFVRTAGAPPPPENQPPVLVPPLDRTDTVGSVVSLGLSASDPNPDVLTYSALGLPPGLSLSPSTGVISGTLTSEGIFGVTVSVSDGRGGVDTESFDWTVEAAPPLEQWLNGQVTIVYARGNTCGTDYATLGTRCAGWLLSQNGLEFNPVVIEDSLHTGKHSKSFVSNSAGTPFANVIFDLGAAAGNADTLILWQYTGSKLDAQVRDFQVLTSDTLAANGQSLVGATVAASGTLPGGVTDNSGQRFDGLVLGRYVQIVGLSNSGSIDTNGLGKVGFVQH